MPAIGSPSGIFESFTTAQINQLIATGFDRAVFGEIISLAGQNHSSTTAFSMSTEKLLQEANFILRQRGLLPAKPQKVVQVLNAVPCTPSVPVQ